jgi:hypothetical protein
MQYCIAIQYCSTVSPWSRVQTSSIEGKYYHIWYGIEKAAVAATAATLLYSLVNCNNRDR